MANPKLVGLARAEELGKSDKPRPAGMHRQDKPLNRLPEKVVKPSHEPVTERWTL
jgi:hypothetical protein